MQAAGTKIELRAVVCVAASPIASSTAPMGCVASRVAAVAPTSGIDEHRPPRIEAMRERNREWLSRHQAEVKQLAAALRRDVAKGHVGAWH